MCTHVDWSRRMAEAHELSARVGVRVWLTTYRSASFGRDGHIVWSKPHWVALMTLPEKDDAAAVRVAARGIRAMEAVLAGGEGA